MEWLHKMCKRSQTNDKIESRINKRPWTSRTFPATGSPLHGMKNIWNSTARAKLLACFYFPQRWALMPWCYRIGHYSHFCGNLLFFCDTIINKESFGCMDIKFEFLATFCADLLVFEMHKSDKIKRIPRLECTNARRK